MAEGIGKIMKAGTRILFALLGGVAGYQTAQFLLKLDWWPGQCVTRWPRCSAAANTCTR